MSAIVFGSPEARAILARDRELRRLELLDEEEVPKGDANELAEQLESLEFRIEEAENDLAALEDEAQRIRDRLKELGPAHKKAGYSALNQWNAWAKGQKVS